MDQSKNWPYTLQLMETLPPAQRFPALWKTEFWFANLVALFKRILGQIVKPLDSAPQESAKSSFQLVCWLTDKKQSAQARPGGGMPPELIRLSLPWLIGGWHTCQGFGTSRLQGSQHDKRQIWHQGGRCLRNLKHIRFIQFYFKKFTPFLVSQMTLWKNFP